MSTVAILWFALSILASYTLVKALHDDSEREAVPAPKEGLYRVAWRSLATGYEGRGNAAIMTGC